jgi:hypothetical protein
MPEMEGTENGVIRLTSSLILAAGSCSLLEIDSDAVESFNLPSDTLLESFFVFNTPPQRSHTHPSLCRIGESL